MTHIISEAEAWTEDEIGKQAFGEAFDYAITLQMATVPTPQGPRPVPVWTLFLTGKSPLLAEGPLYHGPVPVGSPKPVEADVRAQVADGIRQLRELARSRLAGSNGHSPLARRS